VQYVATSARIAYATAVAANRPPTATNHMTM